MGFFAGLNEEKYDRQYSDLDLTKRMADYFRPQTKRLVIVSVLVILLAIIGAALPVMVSRVVDLISQTPDLSLIWLVGVGLTLVGVGLWALNWARRAIIVRAVGDVVLQLRTRAFRSAAENDLSFYEQFSSGRVVSRITSDTNEFGQLVVIITDVGSQLIQTVLLGVILFNTEWRLFGLILIFIPVVTVITLAFRYFARIVTRNGMRAMADVNSSIKETVSGIAIAKNFRQENSIFGMFNGANQQSYRVNVRRGFLFALVFPVLNAVSGIFIALLVYAGGWSVADGIVTAGAWYLFLMSLEQFFFPVLNLSSFWAQIQGGLSAAERVFALIEADSNVKQLEQKDVPPLKGQITFENLGFRYKEGEPILSNFSLNIEPGQTVALVGHTGAGKSSIAKLIARFYEFQSGNLLIDGQDIRRFNLQQYRRQLGIVSQVPFLFSGTVEDNIRYACPNCTGRDEILEMARKVGEGEWLETLPNGLDTEVGERGGRLSMGQRQLVALMRVLIQKPAIFILDEATASVDPFTEWQIQQALDLILNQSTSILIAHRLSTVKAADRIVVMKQGTIIESGNHDGLLAQDGHYAELYNTYFRHQSLSYVEQAKALK
jgi:ATP-binding cassette, subfamily B, bacterial